MGYRLWWHTPDLFNPNNYRKNSVNIFERYRSVNMICIPEEKDTIVIGLEEVK